MPSTNLEKGFSDDDFRRIVAKQLPAWKRACSAADASAIVLHESAFGRSQSELLLLACAIKYAALTNKTVHIACGESDRASASSATRQESMSVRVFREDRRKLKRKKIGRR
jgi:hypothetical protein